MIKRNIFANIMARFWGIISAYCFVPLYLKFLGIEAYGLVGFYSTLAGVLAFADMGFSATLNRELARLSVREGSAGQKRDLLRTYEVAYLGIALLSATTILGLAPLIAEHWLRPQTLRSSETSSAIRLMGLAIALQMPTGLYVGGLMGLEKQVRANVLQVAWGAFRGIGAVLFLWLYAPTIEAFFVWQVISNAAYLLLARADLWRVLSQGQVLPPPHFRWAVFHGTWRYAAGVAGMGLVSTVLMQADKLTLSKMLPLEVLGYYTLAGALAAAPLMVAGPIGLAVFPRLTGFVATGDPIRVGRLYHQACEVVAVATIPAGLTLALFAGDFIFAWTGSSAAAQRAGLVASLLTVGQLMQAITVVPYYLALAHGNLKLNLQIGIASVVVITPLLIVLISRYGVVGAGISWLVLNLFTLPPYMYYLHRRFLPGELGRWAVRSTGRPLVAALPVVVLGRLLMPRLDSRPLAVCLLGLVWCIGVVAALLSCEDLRDDCRRQLATRVAGVRAMFWDGE